MIELNLQTTVETINELAKEKRLKEAISLCDDLLKTYEGNADLWLRKAIYTELSAGRELNLEEIRFFLTKANSFDSKIGFPDIELANFELTFGEASKAEDLFYDAQDRAKRYLNEATVGLIKYHLEKGERQIAKSLAEELTDAELSLSQSLVLADLEEE